MHVRPVPWAGGWALLVLVVSCGIDGAVSADASADMGTDGSVDVWVPTCPGVEGSYDDYDHDNACAGNVGCTGLTCEACTTSCVLCDGERCVEAVDDDSCLTPPPAAAGWTNEPVGGVPDPTSGAVLALAVGTVALADPGVLPTEARWLDGDGNEQARTLVAPVVVVADRALVAGSWVEYNNCTGEKRTHSGHGAPAGRRGQWPRHRVVWLRLGGRIAVRAPGGPLTAPRAPRRRC